MNACAPGSGIAAASGGTCAAAGNPVPRFADWHKNCSLKLNADAFSINNYSPGITHA
jgi:hypothetical protein